MTSNLQPLLVEMIRCPRCGGRFANARVADEPSSAAEHLVCAKCTDRYPMRNGIPCLVTFSPHTLTTLHELLMYWHFYERLRKHRIERDRLEEKCSEFLSSIHLYRTTFYDAISHIEFSRKPLVCDVGAGMCETSYVLSQNGARVIATDFSPFDLLNPRLFSLHTEEIHNFYQAFDGIAPIDPDAAGFRRVVSGATLLPFDDETFDVVFCRSTLHHLPDIPAALAEMARVLKPAGSLIIVCEPGRSILDSERHYLDYLLDYQEGINEHAPTVFAYWRALQRTGFGKISIHCYNPAFGYRTGKVLRSFRLHPDPQRYAGMRASSRFGLLPFIWLGCVVNIYATKKIPRARSTPAKLDRTPIPKNVDLENMLPKPLAEIIFSFEKNLSLLRRITRSQIPAGTLKPEIDFAKDLSHLNRVGWRAPEIIGAERARYPLSDALCFLQGDPSASQLEIEFFGVPRRVARRFKLSLVVNDIALKLESSIRPGWQTLRVELAQVPDKQVLEVHLHQNGLFQPYDIYGVEDYREIGIGIKRIRVI